MNELNKYKSSMSLKAGEGTRSCGYKALACAIIEQAVCDYRYLETNGLVAGGVSIDERKWPKYYDKTKNCLSNQFKNGYGCAAMVNELVWFLKSECLDEMLDELNASVTSEMICDVLGIKRRQGDADTRAST